MWWLDSIHHRPDRDKRNIRTGNGGLSGVYYKPVAVASRVQDGTYFSFFCNARTLVPNAPNRAVLVNIYQPVGDEEAPIIESIKEIR